MIDYNHFIDYDSFILFIDFYKAFDTVNHNFIFKVIKMLGFGDLFLNAVKTLYNGCNSSVKLAHGTSKRFDINQGIRQGCPLSPVLFLLVTQVLAVHIKKSQFNGINALGVEFKPSQFADDTAIFLKDKLEIPIIIGCIEAFTVVSAVKINLEKSVLLPLKDCSLSQIEGIPVKHQVTYLGVVICRNEKH